MDKLSPDCPTGAVSFVQQNGSIDWESLGKYLRTDESREDFAKFRDSLVDNFSSLVQSASTENEPLLQHVTPSDEIFQYVLREWKGFSGPNGGEVHRHISNLASELRDLQHIHRYYAYRKSLSRCDFIKLDSDFEEIFQRLKSENRWPELSDDHLRALLVKHFVLLRELNDNLKVIDVSAGNRVEGNRVFEAINKLYAKELRDTTKNYEERWINLYFVPHIKHKRMVQKRIDQARGLRTEYIPQERHQTAQARFKLKNRALVAKSWILEKVSQMKGRLGGQYQGPGTGRVPGLLLVLASLSLTAVGIWKKQVN